MEISKNWGTIVTIYWRRLFANGNPCPVFQMIVNGARTKGLCMKTVEIENDGPHFKGVWRNTRRKAEIFPEQQ